MKKLIVVLLVFVAFTAMAEDVYIVKTKVSTEGENLWATHAVVPIEAVSVFVPTYFTKNGKNISYVRSYEFSFTTGTAQSVKETKSGVLYRYTVSIQPKKTLPKAKKHIVVTIHVNELGTGGLYAESPGLLALHRAILAVSYKTGYAWITSVQFDNRNVFKVSVALTDRL
ncbi:MAG TPA: hypothetical protein P5522_10110 [Spirochaetia bacterium]|nr:hypothetical protein [Spirochaetia bacterium]